MGDLFVTVRIPSWGLSLSRADYYGWRWCLHVGPFLLFGAPVALAPPD